jgi:hypothetical protein
MSAPIQRNNMYRKMVTENPEKYPARMGMYWTEDEVSSIVRDSRSGDTISTIAMRQQRTESSILGKICNVAYKMHLGGKRLDHIVEFTGLDAAIIQAFINRKTQKSDKSDKSVEPTIAAKKTEPTMSEVVAMIADIHATVHKILDQITVKPTPSASSISLRL